jgi:hypothetical protein
VGCPDSELDIFGDDLCVMQTPEVSGPIANVLKHLKTHQTIPYVVFVGGGYKVVSSPLMREDKLLSFHLRHMTMFAHDQIDCIISDCWTWKRESRSGSAA